MKKLTADRIDTLKPSPAPREWEKLWSIKNWKPSRFGKVRLMQFSEGASVCQWHVESSADFWVPFGPVFIVRESIEV